MTLYDLLRAGAAEGELQPLLREERDRHRAQEEQECALHGASGVVRTAAPGRITRRACRRRSALRRVTSETLRFQLSRRLRLYWLLAGKVRPGRCDRNAAIPAAVTGPPPTRRAFVACSPPATNLRRPTIAKTTRTPGARARQAPW